MMDMYNVDFTKEQIQGLIKGIEIVVIESIQELEFANDEDNYVEGEEIKIVSLGIFDVEQGQAWPDPLMQYEVGQIVKVSNKEWEKQYVRKKHLLAKVTKIEKKDSKWLVFYKLTVIEHNDNGVEK